ncbi:MAG TPA: hypothetical protein VJB57_21745 [Dehalococcoidia bacterium]|nr:hypothetical protein [Dehalococcoidia bacterium]
MTSGTQQTELNLDGVFSALRKPLDLVDSPDRRADFERFIDAARVHQERAIFDLLDQVATVVNEAGTNAHVKLEYQAGRLNLAVQTAEAEESGPVFSSEDAVERVTIRLPAELKTSIDAAAVASGTSINTWYVRTLARALAFRGMRGRGFGEPRPGHSGHRGRGRRQPGSADPD